jgi:hypothetical protein
MPPPRRGRPPGAPTAGDGGASETGWLDPKTGQPLSASDLVGYAIVANAQGVLHTVERVTDVSGQEFFEFAIADPSLLKAFGFLDPRAGTVGPAGRAPPTFASTQAAQTQQEEFLAAQAKLNRQADIEAAELLAEQQAQETRLGTLSTLISDFLDAQSQARNTLANLQPDPFRFAAVAGGTAPFGTTPQQGFQKQLQQFASAPTPTVDPNATADELQATIDELTGAQPPEAPGGFGAAGGANIPLPPPGESVAVRVGEKGEEVLEISAQGVRVIPLGGNFAHGGTIGDFDFQKIKFDKSTLFPALTTSGIFSSLGFSRLPRVKFGEQGRLNLRGKRGAGVFGRLGIAPSFVQKIGSPEVFIVDPETGERRLLGTGALKQVNPRDIVRVPDIEAFGPLGATKFTGAEARRGFGEIGERPSAFTEFSAPIVEPTTGVLLPAPFMVAEQLNQLRVTNPTRFNLLLSAYKAAGVPPQAVIGALQSGLSFGEERGAVGLR